MRILGPALFILSLATSAAAQETPRVTGQNAGDGAQITINAINHDAYPQIRLFASVLSDGAPVTGLTAEDFRVREDEVDQHPLTVEPELPPISVVVTIDTSGSMSRRMEETRAAASAFVAALGPTDAVQLVSFARTVQVLTPMTTTKEPVLQAISGLTARGDTALYNAVYQSVGLLSDRRGRKAIVLLSDGVDDDGQGQPLSTRTITDVLEQADGVGVPIFVVGLGSELDEAVLTDIARTTGADYLPAPSAEELGAVYDQIGTRLSGQYAIRYTSSLPADGMARRVDLAAIGQQTSRSYTPDGRVTVAQPPASTPAQAPSGCPPADTLAIERSKLEQTASRYSSNLITATDRDHARSQAVERISNAFLQSPVMTFDCAAAALEEMSGLYGEKLINATARDTLRSIVGDSLMVRCQAAADEPAILECLTATTDLYGDNLINATMRDSLRDISFDRLLAAFLEAPVFEDHMARIGDLYQKRLITASQRDAAREALLAAE